MDLKDLDIYRLARDLSRNVWLIYDQLNWQDKKIMGDQWQRSVDYICANIAEAKGRFHYKDKIRFHYLARGSLIESIHWTELMYERKKISQYDKDRFIQILKDLQYFLNSHIKSTRKQL